MVTPCKVLVTPRPLVASLDYVLRQLVPCIPGPSWSLVTIILLFL